MSVVIADRVTQAVGVAGAAFVAVAAGFAFAGPNAWRQPGVYDVPWAAGPVRPAGLALDSPLLWGGALALSDGDVLAPADSSGWLDDFIALAGFEPESPPPDPLGSGMSAQLGSRVGGVLNTGTMISPWFQLPALRRASGVAVSVSGRIDEGNQLLPEFGRSGNAGVTALGDRVPFDRVRPAQDHLGRPLDYRLWRSIGFDWAQIPAGSDRVRIRAVGASTDPDGWLAVTGPRLHSVVGLTEFLAGRACAGELAAGVLVPLRAGHRGVANGLAAAPRAVIADWRHGQLETVITDQSRGGDFQACAYSVGCTRCPPGWLATPKRLGRRAAIRRYRRPGRLFRAVGVQTALIKPPFTTART